MSTADLIERQAADALGAFLAAREAGNDAAPAAFAPADPPAAEEFWRAVEALGPLVGAPDLALPTRPANDTVLLDGRGSVLETASGPAGPTIAPVGHHLDTQTHLIDRPATPAPGGLAAHASTGRLAFEGYDILGELHRGGQGVVYRAVQTATKRVVALKVLPGGIHALAQQRIRFEREIDLAASLRHPNIVTVYDSGVDQDRYFFAMEYIRGERLDDFVVARKLSLTNTLRLFAKVCGAVSYAHQRGVIHRDLKPGNIMVDHTGEPRVLDFGLAKVAGSGVGPGGDRMTLTGEFLGTLAYASPEQTRGDPNLIDVRTDVYSLGVILYELLTGFLPYPVVGPMAEVLKAISEVEPVRPSSWSQRSKSGGPQAKSTTFRINNEIETIVLKRLRKERERRYQSAGELAADIERYLAGEPIDAKRDSAGYYLWKMARRYRKTTIVAASVVVIALAGVVVSVNSYRYELAALRESAASRADAAAAEQKLGELGGGAKAALSRAALGWFLLEWEAGHLEQARQIRDPVPKPLPEYAAMTFLLDESETPEQLIAEVPPAAHGLAHFVVGARQMKAGKYAEAEEAFRASLKAPADQWLHAAAEARLAECMRAR